MPRRPHRIRSLGLLDRRDNYLDMLRCRSGARTPKTGVWEGRLPALHAQARMFAQAPHRFVFKQAGEPMGALGLPPQDEAQVVWTWLRGR